jgi:hypothetical protein
VSLHYHSCYLSALGRVPLGGPLAAGHRADHEEGLTARPDGLRQWGLGTSTTAPRCFTIPSRALVSTGWSVGRNLK